MDCVVCEVCANGLALVINSWSKVFLFPLELFCLCAQRAESAAGAHFQLQFPAEEISV